MSLSHTVLSAFKWSILGELVSKTIGPLVLVVLARILVPEDFGVVAAATVVVSFSQVFWDGGLAKTLVQRKDRVHESATVIFWINIVFGFALFVTLFITADLIALFFDDGRVASVVRILGLQLPLAATCSVHIALQQREFAFERLFWVRLATTAAPALASIPLAINGYGYWALVAGTLLGQAAQTTVLWALTSWSPKVWFDRDLAVELFRFGRWVMLSALLGWAFLWVDALVVGGFLGTHDLGLYKTGDAFVTVVFGLIAAPLVPVVYSLFSRLSHDPRKLRDTVLLMDRAMMFLVLPAAAGLILLKDVIPELIFTPKWAGIGTIIVVIGIAQALSYTVTVKQQVYRAIGRPEIETKVMMFSLLVRLVFYGFSVHYGLLVFVWARLASTVLGVANHLFFAGRVIEVGYRAYLTDFLRVLPPVVLMYLIGRTCQNLLGDDLNLILRTLTVIVVCGLSYGLFVVAIENRLVKGIYRSLKQKNSRVIKDEPEP
ncbi:lipopolysaccharide biosynthesis protein [Pseudomonadota bacterium]